MCCQSLGSSAGIQGPGDPTTANSWMLNSSQHPAEECWAPSQACWAEICVDGFQGSAQRSRFCGKIQIWTCQWGKQLPLLHPALLHQLLWESIYSCPVCPRLQEGKEHSREVNTGRCLVSQGSTLCQEQSPAAWGGGDPAGRCAVKQGRARLQACSGRGLAGTGQDRTGQRDPLTPKQNVPGYLLLHPHSFQGLASPVRQSQVNAPATGKAGHSDICKGRTIGYGGTDSTAWGGEHLPNPLQQQQVG